MANGARLFRSWTQVKAGRTKASVKDQTHETRRLGLVATCFFCLALFIIWGIIGNIRSRTGFNGNAWLGFYILILIYGISLLT
jgi:hypothetical protein